MDYYKNKITYPIFKEGDTVKFSGENIDYNNPYSNLFTEKTFIIKNTPIWNQEYNDWIYDFQSNTGSRYLLQQLLSGVYKK